jgi:uncharacterized protein (UPF0335 family)
MYEDDDNSAHMVINDVSSADSEAIRNLRRRLLALEQEKKGISDDIAALKKEYKDAHGLDGKTIAAVQKVVKMEMADMDKLKEASETVRIVADICGMSVP